MKITFSFRCLCSLMWEKYFKGLFFFLRIWVLGQNILAKNSILPNVRGWVKRVSDPGPFPAVFVLGFHLQSTRLVFEESSSVWWWKSEKMNFQIHRICISVRCLSLANTLWNHLIRKEAPLALLPCFWDAILSLVTYLRAQPRLLRPYDSKTREVPCIRRLRPGGIVCK